MTLQERLQKELMLGEELHVSHMCAPNECMDFKARNTIRWAQEQALQPTIANIEADLKGLMPSPYTVDQLNAVSSLSSEWAQMVKHNSTVSDAIAAIERYTRRGRYEV